MSLLDKPRERFTVYPSTDEVDEFDAVRRMPGNPSGPGIVGRGWVTRPKADTAVAEGFDTSEGMVLTARNFPFGARSVVRWQGRLWDVVDEPLVRDLSTATQQVSARLVARTGVDR